MASDLVQSKEENKKAERDPVSMNNSEEIKEFKEYLGVKLIETLLIGAVTTFGFVGNFLSFLILIRHKNFKNSFGYLTAYGAITNACLLLILSVWATPWTLFAIPIELQGLNLFVGQLSLFFEESSFHCSLLITINRIPRTAIYPLLSPQTLPSIVVEVGGQV
ncbi:hypothetical protein COOONC_09144 [Cooperia oncophora]